MAKIDYVVCNYTEIYKENDEMRNLLIKLQLEKDEKRNNNRRD